MAQFGGGQPSRRPLNVTRASSETSADGRKVEGRLERKGKVGERMLATVFQFCPAILKT